MGSIALYLEADGDGARLALALAECAERGVGVSVLKVGASPAGALAAAAHTGAVAGDQRVFRALVEEAGAAWAEDVHELLELAKAQAVPAARPRSPGRGGLAVLTCSGGDSALAADHCARNGQDLPAFAPATATRLRELLPDAATVGNPLDYTALIWGEVDTLRDIVVTVADDPAIEQIVVLYDQPDGIEGAAGESWAAVREGIRAGAAATTVPVMVSSTLPELLDDAAAGRFAAAGVPAIAGLRSGLDCAAALRLPAGDPERLREIAGVAARRSNGALALAEHQAKDLLRDAGVPVVDGRVAAGEDDAAARHGGPGPRARAEALRPHARAQERAARAGARPPQPGRRARRLPAPGGPRGGQRRGARGADGGAGGRAARVRPARRRGARAGGGPRRRVDRDPRRRGRGAAAGHARARGGGAALAARRGHPHRRPRRHAAGRRQPPRAWPPAWGTCCWPRTSR